MNRPLTHWFRNRYYVTGSIPTLCYLFYKSTASFSFTSYSRRIEWLNQQGNDSRNQIVTLGMCEFLRTLYGRQEPNSFHEYIVYDDGTRLQGQLESQHILWG